MNLSFKRRVFQYFQRQIHSGNCKACLAGLEACIRTGNDLTVLPYDAVIPFLVSNRQWSSFYEMQPRLLPSSLWIPALNNNISDATADEEEPSEVLYTDLPNSKHLSLSRKLTQKDPLVSSSFPFPREERKKANSESTARSLIDLLSKQDKTAEGYHASSLSLSSFCLEVNNIRGGPYKTQKTLFTGMKNGKRAGLNTTEESWRERFGALVLRRTSQATQNKKKLRIKSSSSISSSPLVLQKNRLNDLVDIEENEAMKLNDPEDKTNCNPENVVGVLLEAAISAYLIEEGHAGDNGSPTRQSQDSLPSFSSSTRAPSEPNDLACQPRQPQREVIYHAQKSLVELTYCAAANQILLPERTVQHALELLSRWLKSIKAEKRYREGEGQGNTNDLPFETRSHTASLKSWKEPFGDSLQTAYDLLAAYAVIVRDARARGRSSRDAEVEKDLCTLKDNPRRDSVLKEIKENKNDEKEKGEDLQGQERLSRALRFAGGWELAWALSRRSGVHLTWHHYEHLLHLLLRSHRKETETNGKKPVRKMTLQESWKALEAWLIAMREDAVVPTNAALEVCLEIISCAAVNASIKDRKDGVYSVKDTLKSEHQEEDHSPRGFLKEFEQERILLRFAKLLTSFPPITNTRHKKNPSSGRGNANEKEENKNEKERKREGKEKGLLWEGSTRPYTLSSTLINEVVRAAQKVINTGVGLRVEEGDTSTTTTNKNNAHSCFEAYDQFLAFISWTLKWSRPPRLSTDVLDDCVRLVCGIVDSDQNHTRSLSFISQLLHTAIRPKGDGAVNERLQNTTKRVGKAACVPHTSTFSIADSRDRFSRCFLPLRHGTKVALRLILKQLSLHRVCCSTDSLVELFGCAAAAAAWGVIQREENIKKGAEKGLWMLPYHDRELWQLMIQIIAPLHEIETVRLNPQIRSKLALTVAEQSLWVVYPQLLFLNTLTTNSKKGKTHLHAFGSLSSPIVECKQEESYENVPHTGVFSSRVDDSVEDWFALRKGIIRYLEKSYAIALEHFLPKQTELWNRLILTCKNDEGSMEATSSEGDFLYRLELLRGVLLDNVSQGDMSRSAVDLQWAFRCLILDEIKLRLQLRNEKRLRPHHEKRGQKSVTPAKVESRVDAGEFWWGFMPWLAACMTSECTSVSTSANKSLDWYATGEIFSLFPEKTFIREGLKETQDDAHGSFNESSFSESKEEAIAFRNALTQHIMLDDFVLYRLWDYVLRTSKDRNISNSNPIENTELNPLSRAERHQKMLREIVWRILIQRHTEASTTERGVGLLTHSIILQTIEEA